MAAAEIVSPQEPLSPLTPGLPKRRTDHLLRPACNRWLVVKQRLEEAPDVNALQPPPSPVAPDALVVKPEEIKQVSKDFQHAVQEFKDACGEGVHEVDGDEIARKVLKSFEACMDILLRLREGAGICLRDALLTAGSHLTDATDLLGGSAGTRAVTLQAGVAVDCAKDFEKIPLHNRVATVRRITFCLAELTEVEDRLKQALCGPLGEPSDAEDEDLDCGDSDFQELQSPQKEVVEALSKAVGELVRVLKAASEASLPTKNSSSLMLPLTSLEAVAIGAAAARESVQGLTTATIGELDVPVATECLSQLLEGASSMGDKIESLGTSVTAEALSAALIQLKETLEKATKETQKGDA